MKKKYEKTNKQYQKAIKTIPLATQTTSKSAANFVKGAYPLFLEKGKGGEVWDIDGNKYIDYILGLLPIVLGYQDNDCLLYTSPSPRDGLLSRMPSSA